MDVIIRWVGSAFKLCVFLGGLILTAAVAVQVSVGWIDNRRAKAAETVNAPDILIDRGTRLEYPDPLHVTLPDGRTFRLAYIDAPPPEAPEYLAAMDAVGRPLASGGNRLRGLRIVGSNAAGETLVEPWGFHTAIGLGGKGSWSERRAARIPRWNRLTWQLVASGLYYLDARSADDELLHWQDVARREKRGLWADPEFCRIHERGRTWQSDDAGL